MCKAIYRPHIIGLTTLILIACGGGNSNSTSSAPGTPTASPNPAITATPTPEPTTASGARWQPGASATWNWQLSGTLNTSYPVDVYDIDLFDTSTATIQSLKNAGRRVVCYFSAGSAENWRDDYSKFPTEALGNALDGWAGEKWIDTRSTTVRTIMQARLDLAKSKGCDGVEPDNVDAYSNSSGFALTRATQLDYNRFLAQEAHKRNLAIGLKNDVDQLAELAGEFDFAVNEQCFQYKECSGYKAFTDLHKPVFNAEYAADYQNNTAGVRDALCVSAKAANIRTLVLALNLDDSLRFSCDAN